jgi:polyisoprenoid-binding protein YceI
MNKAILFAPLLVSALSTLALGCEDPAKNKTKAVTGEAQAITETATPSAASKAFTFDPQTGSKIEWVGSKVTGKHEGGFRQFKGIVQVDPSARGQEKGRVDVEIDTSSLYTDNDKLVGHLKTADFFDVEHHPKATFVTTDVKKGPDKWTITGNLTLRGITKSVTFPAKVNVTDAGVDVDAEFAINRKDFDMKYAGKADDLIRDDVAVKLTIRSKPRSS